MPILKMEGWIWDQAKQLKQRGAWVDNADLRSFPEVKRQRKEMDLLPPFVWVADEVMVLGYRPYGMFICMTGGVVMVNAVSWMLPFFIGSGDVFWFWFFAITLMAGSSMVYYGLLSRCRRFIAFDRQRGLVHFSRPLLGRYLSVPWQQAHFMRVHWHFPNIWKAGKTEDDAFYFLPPPFLSEKSSFLSSFWLKQMISPGHEPDEQWWLAVNFMCHGPAHQRDMAKMLAIRQENCEACFDGDMTAMQYFVGTKIKVLGHGAGNFERPFDYGKEWKHLDMSKLPTTPSHVIDASGKWQKLKPHEREAHTPGPAWQSLTPEQAEALFDGPQRKRKTA